jgi:hypothetical protein
MKNAILISGSAGSGKMLLTGKIKRQFTKSGFMDAKNPNIGWLAPGSRHPTVFPPRKAGGLFKVRRNAPCA